MKELGGKKEVIRQLREKILTMEGFSSGMDGQRLDFGLGPMVPAFPGGAFPTGAVHEFVSPTEVCAAASNGFLSGLLHVLMKKGGICLWISKGRKLFPPALKFFGIEPHHVIFIDIRRDKDALWVMEQGLKCKALAAVVAELKDISFAESRRLQLAVENSRVTGFVHRCHPGTMNTLACVSRWRISPLPSRLEGRLPGVGLPRWEVELEKIRNGRPGIWQLEWQAGAFRHVAAPSQAVSGSQSSKKEKHYA
jgi:protein ImuA